MVIGQAMNNNSGTRRSTGGFVNPAVGKMGFKNTDNMAFVSNNRLGVGIGHDELYIVSLRLR